MPILKSYNHLRGSAPLHVMLSSAVSRGSHPPFISNRIWSLPQKEGERALVFYLVLYCFLNLYVWYRWPTGLQGWELWRITKSLENYLLLVKKGEHMDCFILSLDFIESLFNTKSNSSSLHFWAGTSKEGLKLKSKQCVGCPGHLVGKKEQACLSGSTDKWKHGHVEGEQAAICTPSFRSLLMTPQELGLWGCPCFLRLEVSSILHSPWMVRMASQAQGRLGHHMEGSWQLCVAALEEPGNKGQKYRLKQQNVQK